MSAIAATARYPFEREADVVLRDGATVHVRPVRAEDGSAMRVFFESVSSDSIWFRFFGTVNLDWVTKWSVNVDYADRFGLVVESGSPRAIVAHAVYVRIDSARAEVAFLVADAWQGRGISTILLAHLAEVAERHEISTFFAQVLPHNHRMIDVFRESGFPVELRSAVDTVEVELPTSLSAAAVERFEERERIGAVAAVRSFFEPRSVAVIGASRRRGTIGGRFSIICWRPSSEVRCMRSMTRPTWCSRCGRIGRCVTFRVGSSWRSWRCRPRRWWVSRVSARRPVCVVCW